MRASDHLPDRYNAAEWFVGRHVREGHGERLALVSDEGRLTYAQLDEAVRRAAGVFLQAGLHRGDRVALLLPDSMLLSTCFWGALAAGLVPVPLNPLLKLHDHQRILEDCDARLVVADAAMVDAGALAAPARQVWSDRDAAARVAAGQAELAYAATHRDGIAFMLYSSGTTGEPKGVVHLQHDMWVCCETYGRTVLGIRPDDRCFSVAKLFFAYGLGNAQYFPFHVGATAVLFAGRPTPGAVFDQVARHRPTLFFGVPTAYAHLLAAMEEQGVVDLGPLRACLSAGEALPASLFVRWKERTGLEIWDGIGSTEICHIFLSSPPGACKPGSTGKPVEGYRLRLVDPDGQDVPQGQLGDLLVSGDSTMAFYWNQHEATKRALVGEWIRTGDKYLQDPDGYYFHGGRSDDMLKAGGIWVSPVEVEGVLMAHPAVLECAVVGSPDEDGLIKVHAYVTLRPGATQEGLTEALQTFAKARLAAYKAPRWVTVREELPKTATGKIQRFILRRGQS